MGCQHSCLVRALLALIAVAALVQGSPPALHRGTASATDRKAQATFQQDIQKLWRAVPGQSKLPCPTDFRCCPCARNSFSFSRMVAGSNVMDCKVWRDLNVIPEFSGFCKSPACTPQGFLPPSYTLIAPRYYAQPYFYDSIALPGKRYQYGYTHSGSNSFLGSATVPAPTVRPQGAYGRPRGSTLYRSERPFRPAARTPPQPRFYYSPFTTRGVFAQPQYAYYHAPAFRRSPVGVFYPASRQEYHYDGFRDGGRAPPNISNSPRQVNATSKVKPPTAGFT